jgi:hypothetical protein
VSLWLVVKQHRPRSVRIPTKATIDSNLIAATIPI